jgi:DNA-binding CsgD family transcriptional regulator
MSARIAVALLAAMTVFANLWFGVGWVLASVAGVAVFGVGESAGWLLSKRSPRAVDVMAGSHPLSPREIEVAVLIAQGLTSKQVGRRLLIERGTVDTHVQHIYNKLNIDSRPQLAVWLVERGLLPRAGAMK